MRILIVSVFACLVATSSALAQSTDAATQSDSKPSEESVRHLLEVMQAKKILQAISAQMDSTFNDSVNRQLDGQNLTPEQQKSLDARRQAAAEMVKELLSWDAMERLYLKVYTDTFTQSEIDGMTAFYSTPAGSAVIAKLPLVAKNTMTEIQQRMQQMLPKLQQMAKEAVEEAKAPRPATTQGPAKNSG